MSTVVRRRIRRLYPALSAKERVLLALEERKARGVEHPFLFASAPADQAKDLQRLWRDVGVVNHELGGVILGFYHETLALEWRWRWFEALAAHAADLHLVQAALGVEDSASTRLEPPVDVDTPEDETVEGGARRLLKGIRDQLVGLAAEAYATEQILGKFSADLGGDALRPDARELLTKATGRLDALFTQVEEWIGPVARREDVGEYLAMARRIVEVARRR